MLTLPTRQAFKSADELGAEARNAEVLNDAQADDTNQSIVARLFDHLADTFYVKKLSGKKCIRRAMLKALGLICRYFPAMMEQTCVTVGSRRLDVLTNLLTVPAEDEEDRILTGRLEGLQHALHVVQFVEVAGTPEKIRLIYSHICEILSKLAKVSERGGEFHQQFAALELFAAHSNLFKEVLVDPSDLKNLCDVRLHDLLQACVHRNDDVHTKAMEAYDAWLGCIRQRLVADAQQGWNVVALASMIKTFDKYLKGDNARSRCVSLRGFGSFAAPIKAIKGEPYLLQLWVNLTSYMTGILGHGDQDSQVKVSYQLPSLIIAFCGLLSEMSQVRPPSSFPPRPPSSFRDPIGDDDLHYGSHT